MGRGASSNEAAVTVGVATRRRGRGAAAISARRLRGEHGPAVSALQTRAHSDDLALKFGLGCDVWKMTRAAYAELKDNDRAVRALEAELLAADRGQAAAQIAALRLLGDTGDDSAPEDHSRRLLDRLHPEDRALLARELAGGDEQQLFEHVADVVRRTVFHGAPTKTHGVLAASWSMSVQSAGGARPSADDEQQLAAYAAGRAADVEFVDRDLRYSATGALRISRCEDGGELDALVSDAQRRAAADLESDGKGAGADHVLELDAPPSSAALHHLIFRDRPTGPARLADLLTESFYEDGDEHERAMRDIDDYDG